MKKTHILLSTLIAIVMISCGGKEEKKDGFNVQRQKTETKAPAKSTDKASARIDLSDKGIGPVSSVSLGDIDQALAAQGKANFETNCMACHRVGKKFIGPDPTGVTKRRSPEWIMNMILNPEQMIQENPLAKDLFMEFNGSPMANQGLTQDDARAVLEYFRTL